MNKEQQDDLELSRRELIAGAVAAGVATTLPFSSPAFGESSATPQAANLGLSLKINGKAHDLKIDPRASLLDTLRETVGLTGTKKGCDHGQCGACTVHVNGQRVLSCLTLAATCGGDEVTTIEGLADGETLHPVQQAFIDHDAFQCGYCTSGQIMSAVALINEGHAKTEDEVRELMSGNLCRCGAYPNICKAVMEAQTKMAGR
jgi:xanthine dehydrogenase YagT iron-sulfur-binding subunit